MTDLQNPPPKTPSLRVLSYFLMGLVQVWLEAMKPPQRARVVAGLQRLIDNHDEAQAALPWDTADGELVATTALWTFVKTKAQGANSSR